jgi:hypothetical protein
MSTLPDNYLDNWISLARWAILNKHGPAASYALMFALSLRWSVVIKSVSYVQPRLWKVTTPKQITTNRVSLFGDGLMNHLLQVVRETQGLKHKVFPRTPCGSENVDAWSHTKASRTASPHPKRNFATLTDMFGLSLSNWNPTRIAVVSSSVFYSSFDWDKADEEALLRNQFATHPKNAYFAIHKVDPPKEKEKIGRLYIQEGLTCFVPYTGVLD